MELDATSDGRFTSGKGGVNAIAATGDGKVEFVAFENHTLAFVPHKGDWESAKVWQAAEDFDMEVLIGQIAPTEHGKNPTEKSFLELLDDTIHVSA